MAPLATSTAKGGAMTNVPDEVIYSVIINNPQYQGWTGAAPTGKVDTRPLYSKPVHGVWPGLVAAILMSVAMGLAIYTALAAWKDHRRAQRAHAQELEILRRTGEDEKLHTGSVGGTPLREMPELRTDGRDAPHRNWKPDGDLDAMRRLNASASADVLTSPTATSPPVTVDHARRYHGAV